MNESTDVAPLVPAGGAGFDRERAVDAMKQWFATPSLRDAVAAWCGDTSVLEGEVFDVVPRLAEFSRKWDFRNQRERTEGQTPELTDDQNAAGLRAANDLGLVGEAQPPSHPFYDHILVPGGKVRACLVRNAGAADLLSDGLNATQLSALGSFRTPLLKEEVEIVEEKGLGVASEFEAMDLGLRRAHGLSERQPEIEASPDPVTSRSWRVHRYHRTDGTPLIVLAAPSSEPDIRPRANTPDTFAWWAEHIARIGPEDKVLVVTSQIYVPFQHTDAVRMLALPYGCAVETYGVPATISAGLDPQTFKPFEYFQEIRSAVLSMQRLCDAIASR